MVSGATLAGRLLDACAAFAERTALVEGERSMTYGELADAIAAVAGQHRDAGVELGDRVVCQLPNGIAHFVAAGAAWSIGAAHVAADRELTRREAADLVSMTEAKLLLDDPAAVAAATASGLATAMPPEPDDIAAIFTTSGSTGRPKLPLGTHGKLQGSWTGLAAWLGFGPSDVHLVQLPLSHGFGLMLATAGLLSGGRLVVLDDFTADRALDAIERERVTVLNGTPTHFRLLLDRLQGHDVRTLRIGVAAGATFPVPLLEAIYESLGMELLVMYGSSEGVGVATRERDQILAGSVGEPDPPGSVAILDLDGDDALPVGAVGEIAFARSVNPVRYWGETTEDAARRANGWYRSGDLGRLDDDGLLYVVGRIKHQINRGGLNIDPAEVEAALRTCTGVADAAVIGVPNPVLDEVVCACVVPSPGAAPALEPLRAQLGQTLASFKLPEELCVLDAIPRTGIGKVDHAALRATVLSPTTPS